MVAEKKKVYFALLGFGKLGKGVYKIWDAKREKIREQTGFDLELKYILIKNATFRRPVNVDPKLFTDNVDTILKDPSVKVAIDVIGDIEPTYTIIKKFINKRINIISANRFLLATKMHEISDLASKNGIHFLTEPAIGGGIPVSEILQRDLVANNITELYGISSGVSNFILNEMTQRKISLSEVLKLPEIPAMAESISIVDYEGSDAAMKASILAATAFGIDVNYLHIYAEGISDITAEDIFWAGRFGYEIKLLSIMRDHQDSFEIRIHPTFVKKSHPMISVKGKSNAYLIKTDLLGEFMVYGEGVGTNPPSSLILRDLVEIGHRIYNQSHRKRSHFNWNNKKIKDISNIETSYYIRFPCKDEPGVMREVTAIIGNRNINISSVHAEIDKSISSDVGFVHIFMDEALEKEVQAAMHEIKTLDLVRGDIKYFRILKSD
jgi:homoserine dehydrogenase